MKKFYKGVVEGNIIRLEENIDLPSGTQALLTLKLVTEEEQDIIKSRQLKLLEKGFCLGKKLCSNRDEIYDR